MNKTKTNNTIEKVDYKVHRRMLNDSPSKNVEICSAL